MNGALHFAIRSWSAGLAAEISCAPQFDKISCRIFDDLVAVYDVGVFQPHLATRPQAEVFRRGSFHEIIAVDVKLTGKGHFPCTGLRRFRIIHRLKLLDVTLRKISQDKL